MPAAAVGVRPATTSSTKQRERGGSCREAATEEREREREGVVLNCVAALSLFAFLFGIHERRSTV